jgi:hypothetical protein
METSSRRILRRITYFLDAPWLRWTGSAWTLWSILSLGFGFTGRLVDTGYEGGANLLIVAGAIGLFVQLVGSIHRKQDSKERMPRGRTNSEAERAELDRAIESELAALIDEWKALRASEFTETANAPYDFLLRRTSYFIETIFGRPEAQRFEDNCDEKPQTRNQLVASVYAPSHCFETIVIAGGPKSTSMASPALWSPGKTSTTAPRF